MVLLFGMTSCDISKVKTTLAVHVSLDLTNIYTDYSFTKYKIQIFVNTSIHHQLFFCFMNILFLH